MERIELEIESIKRYISKKKKRKKFVFNFSILFFFTSKKKTKKIIPFIWFSPFSNSNFLNLFCYQIDSQFGFSILIIFFKKTFILFRFFFLKRLKPFQNQLESFFWLKKERFCCFVLSPSLASAKIKCSICSIKFNILIRPTGRSNIILIFWWGSTINRWLADGNSWTCVVPTLHITVGIENGSPKIFYFFFILFFFILIFVYSLF